MAESRVCSVDGCDKQHYCRGWCRNHHARWKRNGDPTADKRRKSKSCSVKGCGKKVFGYGFCQGHYRRRKLHGDPLGGRIPSGERARYLREVALPYKGDDCLAWPYACLKQNGYGVLTWEGRQQPVHRVICRIIHGPAPSPKHQAAHLCGKGHEGRCAPKHIVWKTPTENHADKLLHGTTNRGERNSLAKLSEADVRGIRAARGKITQEKLADKYGVSPGTISQIQLKRRWTWLE